MESPIPLPTDNIYKFYALFGLSLFIFCGAASVYSTHSTNETILQSIIENASITDTNSVAVARKQVLEKRYGLAVDERKAVDKMLKAGLFLSTALMILGFVSWQINTQPVQDEMAKLQLEKLRIEVEQLRKPATATGAVETLKDSLEAED